MAVSKVKSNVLAIREDLEKIVNASSDLSRQLEFAGLLTMARNSKGAEDSAFYLPHLADLEDKAIQSQALADAVAVWAIPFYAQRKYWFKLFIGFNFGIFSQLLTNWTLNTIPDPTWSDENMEILTYLKKEPGLASMEEIFGDRTNRFARKLKSETSQSRSHKTTPEKTTALQAHRRPPSIESDKSKLSLASVKSGFRHLFTGKSSTAQAGDELTENSRQSKLSQEQLSELQRSTHFDKKELQQWYKGKFAMLYCCSLSATN